MAIILKKVGRKRGAKVKWDWDKIRADFIASNLASSSDGRYMTLEECAEKWKVPFGTLRNHAAKGKWVEAMMAEKKTQATDAVVVVRENMVFNEVETRSRQAQYAILAQEKAIAKLRMLKPEYLTVREAVLLLQLGFEGERKAMGLPDQFNVDFNPATLISKAQEVFQRRLLSNTRVEKALAKALEVIDVDFQQVSDDGITGAAVR